MGAETDNTENGQRISKEWKESIQVISFEKNTSKTLKRINTSNKLLARLITK